MIAPATTVASEVGWNIKDVHFYTPSEEKGTILVADVGDSQVSEILQAGPYETLYEPDRMVGTARPNRLRRQLDDLRSLPDNWNGYGSAAPNATAFHTVDEILFVLHEMELRLEPKAAAPSAEDGIALLFSEEDKEALIECSNEGEVAAIVYRRGKDSLAWTIGDSRDEIREALQRIDAYIHGRIHP